MEDRVTPGLFLEMTHLAPETFATRAREMVAHPGVGRATWWENAMPGRTDLPRKLPEFSVLGVYEVDDGFAPPPHEHDVASLQFRRCPRPAQGNLSGRPTIGLSLVLIGPKHPQGAQALRDWADFVHIRAIAASGVPGFTMITPYERVGASGDEEDGPRYLHLYELDADDPEASFGAMPDVVSRRLGGGRGTPAFDEWAWHPELVIWYVNTFRLLSQAGA